MIWINIRKIHRVEADSAISDTTTYCNALWMTSICLSWRLSVSYPQHFSHIHRLITRL